MRVVLLAITVAAYDPENQATYLPTTYDEKADDLATHARHLFDRAARAASTARCRAPVAGHKRSGFGSYLRILAHEAEDLLIRGRAPTPLLQHALLEQGVGNVGDGRPCAKKQLSSCVFHDAFVEAKSLPICPCANPNPVNCRGERHRALPYKDGEAKRAVEDWRRFAETYPFWASSALFSAVLRPQKRLRTAIADATTKLGDAPRPWVAAHLRRGDACRDGAYMGRTCSSGDDYARACCDAGRKYGFGTLIVATDSSSALAELTAALAERRCPFTVKATSDTSVDDKTRESARVEDLLESNVLDSAKEFAGVLVDVFLLASGDVYIGKFTSNLDRLAYALLVARKGVAAPYVSLDTAWSKDTPALFDAATHRPLQKLLNETLHKSQLRNITRKKLRVDECRAPRAVAGWSETGSRWWCPATTTSA
jgi:hypothetical protein